MSIQALADVERIDIPARQLTGTRDQKLKQLDEFLAQLRAVRLLLAGTPLEPTTSTSS